ncbi:unnamed protein product [Arctia plantaginis]|uniref:LITAF domain-containing protein n=1 Tax=Arctia plantaginis TaxID=874455 RepID=A0A8S1B653_ARCPL|nr:unnamed protein product [Arctia plantaginis]
MSPNSEKHFTADPPPYSDNSTGIPLQTNVATPGAATVVVGSPVVHTTGVVVPVVVGNRMGPKPASQTCPSCRAQIVTRVEHKTTTKTHLFATLLCFLACWCCVCIPYCTDSCKNADHYCPNCDAYIGSYNH